MFVQAALGIEANYRVVRIARPAGKRPNIHDKDVSNTDICQLFHIDDALDARSILFDGGFYTIFKRHLVYGTVGTGSF